MTEADLSGVRRDLTEIFSRMTRDELSTILLSLLTDRGTSRSYPPGVSIAEMAERWGTWGVGPRA